MFFPPEQYQLLDFGEGRCLERFGSYVLNRRYPSVDGTRKGNVELWKDVDAIFLIDKVDRRVNPVGRGTWKPVLSPLPESWTITSGQLVFELKFTPFGHIGIFPEHAVNWETITNLLMLRSGAKVLNLFGY
ncbi:MAG: hypothetical protein LBU65_04435, partial [Planctomycetaceae bacterium]|nr:hypothetical protein [Planctomycetaceae bacterium]